MKHLLALDQGTTSSRAIVFDETGSPVATAQREHQQFYPAQGWVEHDPWEIWRNQLAVATEALAQARLSAREISGIGITNQRETTIVWDRASGEPVGPAIVWQDRRTAAHCAALQNTGTGPLFTERTGLRLDPYFSGTKIAWILANLPEARERAAQGDLLFGTIDTWLIWNLTEGKVHATDASNASRTLLLNLHTAAWDPDCLAALEVPSAMLPRIADSSGVLAEVSAPGPLQGIPIAGIAGDQQSALFGQACFEPGMAKNTYGTGCFLLLHTGRVPVTSQNNLLTTIAWRIGVKPNTPWKAPCSSAAPSCNGSVTNCGSSTAPRNATISPLPSPTLTDSTSCPPSPVSVPLTGIRTPGASPSASPAAPTEPISAAPPSKASPCNATT